MRQLSTEGTQVTEEAQGWKVFVDDIYCERENVAVFYNMFTIEIEEENNFPLVDALMPEESMGK